MPLGVLPSLRPYTTVETAPGPLTLPSRPWSVVVVNQTVAAAYTVVLPATPPKNTIVQVKDGKGDASTNTITIDGNNQLIDGGATTTITTDYGAVYLGYDGSEWRQLANVGSGGGGGGSGNSSITITQANVALALGQAVYFDAIQGWIPAIANSASTLGLAIVTAQLSPTTYAIYFSGDVTNLPNPYPIEQGGIAVPDPLEAGEYYYVSASIAGSLTKNEPATYSNPLLFALSTTEAIVLPFRPSLTNAGGTAGVGPYVQRPAAGTTGATYYPTDGPISFIDDGAAWLPLLPGAGLGKEPPPVASWSQQMGAGSATDSAGTILCDFASNGGAHGVKGIAIALPAVANYTIIAGVQIAMYPGQSGTDFAPVGCGWTDLNTWILSEFVQYNAAFLQSQEYYVGPTGSPNGISVITNPLTLLLAAGNVMFWKLVDDGTDRFTYIGGNNFDWTLVYQASRTSVVTPTHFALGCNPYARPAIARLVSYVASVP
jgi:hypothetical protein